MKGWLFSTICLCHGPRLLCVRTVSWCSVADMEASQDGPEKVMVVCK